FFYRAPVAPTTALSSSVANGSFESGTASWSFTNNATGAYSIDTTTFSDGGQSLKLNIPGTTPGRSPTLLSASYPVVPNKNYTVSAKLKSVLGAGSIAAYVVEKSADGSSIQLGLTPVGGTADWTERALSYWSGASAVSATIKVEVFSGYG